MKKIILVFSIFVALIFSIILLPISGCSKGTTENNPDDPGISGGVSRYFALPDLDGNKVSLSDFKGQIIVLNFWASWCPPCREEIPDFIEVFNIYKGKNVQFFGVSNDDLAALEKFEQENRMNYPTLYDRDSSMFREWKITAIPHTFILDENGVVVFDHLGIVSKDLLISEIEKALK